MQHSIHTRCDLQHDLHITKLQIAYAKFLDETFYKKRSCILQGKVRELAGDMVWKLNGISEKTADEGIQIMHKMLEHLWVEYKWGRIVKILQCAMDYAGVQKANACRQVKIYENKLLKMGTRCVGSHHTSAKEQEWVAVSDAYVLRQMQTHKKIICIAKCVGLQPWFASCFIKDPIRFCTLGGGRHLNFKKDLTRI